MREDWSQVGWACAKTISVHHVHFQCFLLSSSCHLFQCPFLSSLFNVPCPCLPSSVPCITSRFLVYRSQSPAAYIYVPCLPSPVPCLTSLFLGSGPLYPVSRDLSPVSHLCSLASVLCTLSHVICPLSHISVPWLRSSVPCLTWSVPCLRISFSELRVCRTLLCYAAFLKTICRHMKKKV